MDISFTIAAFKSIGTIGSITPSSKYLVKKMTRPFHHNKSTRIIEFGSGTGVITESILLHSTKNCTVDAVELDQALTKNVRMQDWSKDARLKNHNFSAFKFKQHLGYPDGTIDVIVSSLPIAILPKIGVYKMLLDCRDQLAPGGIYIQYQYSPYSLPLLKRIFRKVIIGFEGRNFPPALIYTCHK